MKTVFGLFALLIIVAIIIATFQNSSKGSLPFLTNVFLKTPSATIGKQSFSLSLAKKPKELEKGLSERKSLASNEGMLFVFDKPDYYSFWMKNMKFPIDMIFIKKNRIVTIYQDVQSPKSKDETSPIFKPEEPADMVLEINAGLSKKYNIKKGDEVKLENLN